MCACFRCLGSGDPSGRRRWGNILAYVQSGRMFASASISTFPWWCLSFCTVVAVQLCLWVCWFTLFVNIKQCYRVYGDAWCCGIAGCGDEVKVDMSKVWLYVLRCSNGDCFCIQMFLLVWSWCCWSLLSGCNCVCTNFCHHDYIFGSCRCILWYMQIHSCQFCHKSHI